MRFRRGGYEAINAMLLNEFLKEHRKVEQQEASITQLKSTVAKQEATIAQQRKDFEANSQNSGGIILLDFALHLHDRGHALAGLQCYVGLRNTSRAGSENGLCRFANLTKR